MSNAAITWAYKVRTGNPALKMTLVMLADYADENGTCFPSQAKLVEMSELSEKTIRRAIADLKEKGFIEIDRDRRPDGSWGRNRYRLKMDDPISGPPVTVTSGPPVTVTTTTGHSDRSTKRLTPNLEPPIIERERARDEQKTVNLVGSADADFDRLMSDWPNAAVDGREEAFAEWRKLKPSERIEACHGIPRVVAEFTRKDRKHLPGLAKILRERRWQALPPLSLGQATQLAAQARGVFVAKDTPDWRAWQRHRSGRTLPVLFSAQHGADGWWFPSACNAEVGAVARVEI